MSPYKYGVLFSCINKELQPCVKNSIWISASGNRFMRSLYLDENDGAVLASY